MSTIRIPIDASAVAAEERGNQQVRVAAQSGDNIVSTVVDLKSGKAVAELDLDATGPVTIAVGPENTLEAELFQRETPTLTVRPQLKDGEIIYPVKPIVIPPPIWKKWLVWCRTFVINGKIVGPGGDPVPGARVSAFNVDRFWWWSSTVQVGSSTTTAADGTFQIEFRWCCGWLPIVWWLRRQWRLDPLLVKMIDSLLRLRPGLHVTPPSPRLELGFTDLNPQPEPPGRRIIPRPIMRATLLNPSTLGAVREKLLPLLPAIGEFQRLCLWPWCPWTPWLECTPNLVFQASQNCTGSTEYIIQETTLDARPDVSTDLDITLVANSSACTIPPQGTPEGDCFVFTYACYVAPTQLGGTAPVAAAPLGFAEDGDRPFTGVITLSGQFGYNLSNLDYADYYTIYYRAAGTTDTFVPVPSAALQPFSRTYFDSTIVPPMDPWSYPLFSAEPMAISGAPGQIAVVYPSRQFFEKNNPPSPDWNDPLNGQSWTNNIDGIATIDTAGFFPDGAYEFQVVTYTLETDGTLLANGAPNGCGQPEDATNPHNKIAVFIANPSPLDGDPSASIDSISFNGSALPSCGMVSLTPGVAFSFAVNFTASDAEGYLDSYVLSMQHGQNNLVTLVESGTTPAGVLSGPAQVGPGYADALTQTLISTRPVWKGGAITLTVADARGLFPQNCAYDLILTVSKRNIVDCNVLEVYAETVYYSFTVQDQPM